LKILKNGLESYGMEFHSAQGIICPCGRKYDRIGLGESERNATVGRTIGKVPGERDTAVKCPRCHSTQVTGFKKGFGLGKAVGGGVLLGPLGLLAGFVGSRKVQVSCLKCGHRWNP
jgi:ribosomal protein S27E